MDHRSSDDRLKPSEAKRPLSTGHWRAPAAIGLAVLFLVAAAILSLMIGPLAIHPIDVVRILGSAIVGGDPALAAREAIVILDVRLPRTALAMIVGAATAVAGAVMQGLFRNPLADPSLVGVSSGAAFAAALWFVYGAGLVATIGAVGMIGLPVSAFLGSLAAVVILYSLATRDGRTSIIAMLLAGIALTGFASALTGLLIFVSSDQQLREFTFWTLGSLGGATWLKVGLALPFAAFLVLVAPFFARALDALALGESEAFFLGVDAESVKRFAVAGIAAAVGASVAVSGVIAFFGLTVPHLVRLALGPGHRLLLPVSALLGATLLLLADIVARTIVAPAELPLGVITALIGAPMMLWLLAGRRRDLVG